MWEGGGGGRFRHYTVRYAIQYGCIERKNLSSISLNMSSKLSFRETEGKRLDSAATRLSLSPHLP